MISGLELFNQPRKKGKTFNPNQMGFRWCSVVCILSAAYLTENRILHAQALRAENWIENWRLLNANITENIKSFFMMIGKVMDSFSLFRCYASLGVYFIDVDANNSGENLSGWWQANVLKNSQFWFDIKCGTHIFILAGLTHLHIKLETKLTVNKKNCLWPRDGGKNIEKLRQKKSHLWYLPECIWLPRESSFAAFHLSIFVVGGGADAGAVFMKLKSNLFRVFFPVLVINFVPVISEMIFWR